MQWTPGGGALQPALPWHVTMTLHSGFGSSPYSHEMPDGEHAVPAVGRLAGQPPPPPMPELLPLDAPLLDPPPDPPPDPPLPDPAPLDPPEPDPPPSPPAS
jgi:hypothetical protein